MSGHAWLREAMDATHYHTTNVAPVWRSGLVEIGTIGSHVFYRGTDGLKAAQGHKAITGVATLRRVAQLKQAVAARPRAAAVETSRPAVTAVAAKPVRSRPAADEAAPEKRASREDDWAVRVLRP